MTTVGEALKQGQAQLRASEISSHQLDSELLLSLATGKSREWLKAHGEGFLTPAQEKKYLELVDQRRDRTPLVHLTRRREFYGLELEITPDTLTPRIETEHMVELAIKYSPPGSRLLDVGTGCGAIALAIAKTRSDLQVTATDLSNKALGVARRNANRHHVNLQLIESDLLKAVPGRFSVIVANLPYLQFDADLMPEVTKEPALALFGGSDGLDLYRQFFAQVPAHLEPGGFVFTESDPWQHEELIKIAAGANLKPIEQDYFILGFRS